MSGDIGNVVQYQTCGGTSYKGMQPRGQLVLVRRLKRKLVTAGGLALPSTLKHHFFQAEILAIGPGAQSDSGERIPLDDLTYGQLVMVRDDGPSPPNQQVRMKRSIGVEVDGETLFLVMEGDIMAIDCKGKITDEARNIPSPSEQPVQPLALA